MTDELTPVRCGCGGEAWAFMTLYPENVERPYICQCRKCFTRTGGYQTESEAVTAWNKAMRRAKVDVIEYTIDGKGPKPFCPHCGDELEWE